jgi:hypothetical protein
LFFHQWHKLTKCGHKHPNPGRQILNNIKTIILQAISEGMDVCITINTNKALETNNQLFHKWIAECGLVSVHKNLYNEEYYKAHPIPSTYQYGEKEINHVFCTPDCLDASLELPLNCSMTDCSPTTGHSL